jgi:peptide/nickel transport system substrate-binding protein
VARRLALAVALVAALLPVSGAGGADAQTPKRGGTLVIANTTALEPPCLNVLLDECGVDALFSEVLAGAFEVGPNGRFRPDLVSHVDRVSRRPLTLVYHIRSEARWSDGVPVTAADFVVTQRLMRQHFPELPYVDVRNVRSVRALGTKRVRVVLREPDPDWRYLFSNVVPAHALAGAEFDGLWRDEIANPRTGKPIGSGPFLVQRFERGRQLVLIRNPRYWGPHTAQLDRIVYRFMPPAEMEAALRRGEIDMIDPGPAVLHAQAQALQRRPEPGVEVIPTLVDAYMNVLIRVDAGGHPALRRRAVRQALAYGIDRLAIARAIGELSGTRAETNDSVVFLASSQDYRPNWRGYRYRPDLARRLLEQAGCRRGQDGIYSCDGEPLSLQMATSAGVLVRERTVELAQRHLARIGVEIKPVFAAPRIFFGQVLPTGDFDLAVFAWILGASTAGMSDVFGCQQISNFTGYCDRLVTRDLVQATRLLDRNRRVALLNRIDARLARAVPAIPLFQVSGLFAFRASVRGVVPNGTGWFTWNSEDWWLER